MVHVIQKHNIKASHIQYLKQTFLKADVKGVGEVSTKVFLKHIKDSNVPYPQEFLQLAMNFITEDGIVYYQRILKFNDVYIQLPAVMKG